MHVICNDLLMLLMSCRHCLKYANDTEYCEKKLEYQNDYNKRPGQKEKNRQYQNEKNQRPEIKARKQQPAFKAKNLYRVKKSVAKKKQKLAAEKEKNTKIFNQYVDINDIS